MNKLPEVMTVEEAIKRVHDLHSISFNHHMKEYIVSSHGDEALYDLWKSKKEAVSRELIYYKDIVRTYMEERTIPVWKDDGNE